MNKLPLQKDISQQIPDSVNTIDLPGDYIKPRDFDPKYPKKD